MAYFVMGEGFGTPKFLHVEQAVGLNAPNTIGDVKLVQYLINHLTGLATGAWPWTGGLGRRRPGSGNFIGRQGEQGQCDGGPGGGPVSERVTNDVRNSVAKRGAGRIAADCAA